MSVTQSTEQPPDQSGTAPRDAGAERFRALLQAVPSMTFESDLHGRNTFASEQWCAYTGMTPEETAGFGWTRVIHPEDMAGVAARWEQAIRAGEPCEMRHRIRAADGSHRWFLLRSMPVRDASGRIDRWVGSLTDIDDLVRSEARLRSIAQFPEENPNPVMRIGRAGTLLYANAPARAYLQAAGWVDGGALPRALLELCERAFSQSEPIESELGDARELCYWSAAIQPPGEEYVNVYFRDITKRKQAEDALRASERRYRELVQSANSAILRWRRDGAVTFFNEYAESFFGYRAEEVIGRHVGFLVPDQESDGVDLSRLVQEIVDHPERYVNNVNENVCKDGRRVWMAWTNRPILDEHGRVAEILAVGSDITARKSAEHQLRDLNERLTALLAERTRVAEARAAHLRELAGELTRAEQRERDRLYELLHDHVQPLLVAARLGLSGLDEHTPIETWMQLAAQTNRHITDALDTARSLSAELNPPLVRDRGLAPALEWLARWVGTKQGLEVDLRCDPDAEPPDVSLRILCFKAVRELLMNCAKHAGVKRVDLSVRRDPDDRIRITVADAGRGFDAAAVRAAAGTSAASGLWNLERRLGMVGGVVEIDSRRDAGTRVTLLVPLGGTSGAPGESATSRRGAGPGGASARRRRGARR